MNQIFILIFTFYVAVNGDKWPMDLGKIQSQVSVGESLNLDISMTEDRRASLNVQEQLNKLAKSYAIEALGLDPIRRKHISFDVDLIITATITLTNFVATGAKYLNFEQTTVFTNYNGDYLRIDLTASTPILGTKCHFLTEYNIFWMERKVSGRSYVYLEHVRLQIAALLRSEPRSDGSGRKVYQVVGLNMDLDVDNIRIIVSTSDNLPMSPDEIVKTARRKLVEMVAKAIVKEVNLLLETTSLDQVLG